MLRTTCVVLLAARRAVAFSPNLSSVVVVGDMGNRAGNLASTTSTRPSSALFSTSGKVSAEEVLKAPKWPEKWPFYDDDFNRMDETSDGDFYSQPRLVYHIDDAAVKALTKYYSKALPKGADVLDICSSWVSHFPKDWQHGKRTGLGMNEYELSKNEQLEEYKVTDLNVNAKFPFEDSSFDVVTCVVSVDYLNKPLEVFNEIHRVLRPGGKAIMSMSNRCFPTKAIQIWNQTNDMEHIFIVGSYFHYAGGFDPPASHDISPNPGRSDPMYIVEGRKKA
ncbi:unnamed protein product [Laminaria digitata]